MAGDAQPLLTRAQAPGNKAKETQNPYLCEEAFLEPDND